MIPAHSYESICSNLSNTFIETHRINRKGDFKGYGLMVSTPSFSSMYKNERIIRADKAKLVGLLFVQPSHKIAKDEILSNLSYFHQRSGQNVNFYLAGYGAEFNKQDYPDIELACRVNGKDWLFSSSAFENIRRELELNTKWKYSGECDLVITNAKINPQTEKVYFDYTKFIKVNIDELKRIGAIPSVMALFESIFRYADEQDPTDPTWGLSDSLGIDSSKSALLKMILSLLPRNIGKEAEKITHFAVIDASKK